MINVIILLLVRCLFGGDFLLTCLPFYWADFRGRYKANLIPNNEYLLPLSRYIRLNPVRAGLVRKPIDRKYSSYGDYISMNKSEYLDTDIILDKINNYAEFVNSYQEEQNYFIKDMLFK